MDIALLIARLVVGLTLAAHGAQKLFGWFGGYGLKGTGRFFEGIGFRPGTLFAAAAGLGEFVGGLLTAAGLFSPFGPALLVVVMVVAIFAVHWEKGFFAQSGGLEYPLVIAASAVGLAFAGPGAYALDAVLATRLVSQPGTIWLVIAGALVLALLNLATRHHPAPETAASHT
jgi:putative oxidoreductase